MDFPTATQVMVAATDCAAPRPAKKEQKEAKED